ncbi:MAG: helix-turn-helix transcriptional regulator, partial [Gammaproteobacteria bacterium]
RFGELLQKWRQHRQLSQSALSLESNVSQRHLSFLESGRSNPSREMVQRLARVLELPLRERNRLLVAAGFAAAYRERPLDHEDLRGIDRAIDMLLDSALPNPAIAFDARWNLVRANEQAVEMLATYVDPPNEALMAQPNVLRFTFHPDGMSRYIVNRADVADALLLRLRRQLNDMPFDADLNALHEELLGYPFARDASASESGQIAPVLALVLEKDARRLSFFTVLSSFGTPQDVTVQELRIETFFPSDDQTRRILEESNASGSAEPS